MWLVIRKVHTILEEKYTTSIVKVIEIADTKESNIGSILSEFITPSRSVFVKQELTFNFIAKGIRKRNNHIQREADSSFPNKGETSSKCLVYGRRNHLTDKYL